MSVVNNLFLVFLFTCFYFEKVNSQGYDTALYDNGYIKYIEKMDKKSRKLDVFFNEEGRNLLKENATFTFSHFEKKMKANLTIVVEREEVKTEYWIINEDTIYKRIPESYETERQKRAVLSYMFKKVKYPKEAIEKESQGKVILSFIVNEQGEVTNLKPMTHIGYGLEEEAMKNMSNYKNFGINTYHGKAIKRYIELPISFQM